MQGVNLVDYINPYNLNCAVTKSSKYEPQINETFAGFAEAHCLAYSDQLKLKATGRFIYNEGITGSDE